MTSSKLAGETSGSERRWHPANLTLLLIIVAASALRIYAATATPYLPDEHEIGIRIADTISFEAATLDLPLRGPHHPALPSYFIKAGSMLFGKNALGFRSFSLLAGLVMIVVVFRMGEEWYSASAARWAAALLAFNEYHIGVSALATAKGPHLFFVALAMYAFGRFLRTEHPRYLYSTAVTAGLGFLCKEHSALLLPVFFLTLLQAKYRHCFRSSHVFVACAVFFVVIAPDIVWNLRTPVSDFRFTYRDHLSRIGGIGFTPYHLLFFARGAIQSLHETVTGERIEDGVEENPSMNSLFGFLLLSGVVARTLRPTREAGIHGFLMILFWGILGFFMLIRPGLPTKPMDPVVWYFADVTLFPAVILTGDFLAKMTGWWRRVVYCVTGIAILYATAQTIGAFS